MSKIKQSKDQDIRIIQLSKWQIPKSRDVMDYVEDNTYLAIGYFDMIDVRKVRREKMHPLLAAYKMSHRYADSNTSFWGNYSMQELIIFTDINVEHFSQDEIDAFWNMKSLMLYVSLIHIDNESNISDIIKNIHRCFKGKKYLIYFSFDYSGIILLAKEMGLKEYLNLMFQLNYDNTGREKLIRDTYSFYGFQKNELKRYFEKFDALDSNIDEIFRSLSLPGDGERFSVAINVGIQNYNVYKQFVEEIRKAEPSIKEYGLFGRHDISLVNENANLKWLIYVQYLLNKFTIAGDELKEDHLLSTHETFVKITDMGKFADTDNERNNESYSKAKKRLDNLCDDFLNNLDEERYNGEYRIPIRAVKFSVLGILKNRFAEDFVLCMYQSFCEFIEYLMEKTSHKNDNITKFDKCFSNYFRGLNSLVNSAMHSERQFIQATAFNAIIYDVPPKIMAFYVAMIYEFQQLISSDIDNRYTFLLTPSFSDAISMEVISYSGEFAPHDRILMVSINERSLYNPKGVIRRMAHEVAHFVGDDLRIRELRKRKVKLSVIYIILSHIMHGGFLETDDFFDLIVKIEKIISAKVRFSDEENNYSEQLFAVIPDIADEFCRNEEIKVITCQYMENLLRFYLGEPSIQIPYTVEIRDKFREYFISLTEWNGILSRTISGDAYYTRIFSEAEIQVLKNLLWNDIEQELLYINRDRMRLLEKGRISQSIIMRKGSGILNDKTVGEYSKGLIDIYSEAFADIEMVLLTDISYEDYLKSFIIEEGLEVKRLDDQLDDLLRISMVIFALQFTGVWEFERNRDLFLEDSEEDQNKLRILEEEIENQIEILKCNISDEGKQQVSPYYGIAQDITENVGKAERNVKELWMGDGLTQGTDNITFYINENLFIYLVKCIDKSAKHYLVPEKYEKIKELRKTINTVSDFKEVETVFETICNTIRNYKNKIL